MPKHISSLLLAVLLFLGFTGGASNIFLLAAILAGLILLAFIVNFTRLGFAWPHLLLPTFFLLAAGFTQAIIISNFGRMIFVVIAAILFYFLETRLGRESHYLQGMYLMSIFGIYTGLFSLRFYLNLNIWLLAGAIIFFTSLFSLQGYAGFDLSTKRSFIFVTVLVI